MDAAGEDEDKGQHGAACTCKVLIGTATECLGGAQ